ncbi:TRO [Symbiodinium sp. CCMP2592]|nr:TRO [Symbiodinium sp. CCMP2592]
MQVADLQILKVEDVDSLVRKFTEEVDQAVQLQASRCSRLEEELALVQAAENTTEADRQRCVQLENMVDALVQQRRQDLQQSQENLREIDARFHDLDQKEKQEKSWRKEAEAIRQEVQDLRSTHIPSLFQQHMKAMKAMQEGLTAVRSEVKKLGEILEAVQATQNGPGRQEQSEAREVLALKVQVSDLQEQVTEVVVRGLEERFATLRADVSREVASVLRENKEDRSAAWRRLSALEAWPASQAELSAEFHRLRQEHEEDYMLAQVMTETIDKENKHFKRIRDEQLAKKAAAEEALGIVKSSVVPKKERSCQLSQLEQSLGHFPNPHPHDNKPRLDADPQKLLRFGVTGEGQGRGAYLRLEAKKGGPVERYGRALTTAQEIGWTAAPATKTYTSSPFAHRPLLQSQVYRPMGDRGLMEVLRRDVEGLGRQVVQLRRDFSIAQDPTAEAAVVEADAASRVGLLEGLFGTPPSAVPITETTSAPKAVRSAVKLTTSMASSRSPRSSRKRSPEQRRSLDGQVRPRSNNPGERNDRGSTRSMVSGFPAVVGNKLEWVLTAKSLQAAREAPGVAGALLVTGEMEVAGVYCRLKFFPDGSPLRQAPGFCSLYLVCTMPNVNVRFRLFAGMKYSPVLEANTARGGRDQGRHDLCQLKDVLGEDGGIVVGAEILEVHAAA